MKNNFVLYHHPCSDGLLAAYAAYRKLGDTVTYIGVQYGQYTRPEDFERFRDATVWILDFSFKLDLFNELTSIAKRVILLDHHKTTFEELGELALNNKDIHLDMNRSGAMMAWDFFFPGLPAPLLIQHVQDRDLWRFEMKGSKEIQEWILLNSRGLSVKKFAELVDTTPVDQMIQPGSTLLRVQAIQIERHLANHFTAVFEGVRIPISNCTSGHSSEVGNELALLVPFAATYQDISDKRIVSLRSSKGGVDVSLIAKKYGGGGHEHAAGFELPHGQVFWEVENV